MSELLSWKTLVHATAGAAGSVTAMTVFFPLDTARTRLQVNSDTKASSFTVLKDLVEKEGWPALYHGLQPVLVSLCVSNFVYFYTFNGLKHALRKRQIAATPMKDLLMAITAGITNVLATTPLWVCNMRIRLQGSAATLPRSPSPPDMGRQHVRRPYTGIFNALSRIAREEGATGLWSGTLPSLLLVSNPAVQFMVYESLKRQVTAGERGLSSFRVFLIGALAKAVATILTYPLQLAQARLRAQLRRENPGDRQSRSLGGARSILSNLVTCLQQAFAESGIAGLFKGLEIKLVQTVSMAALMFVAYEKIATVVFYLLRAETSSGISDLGHRYFTVLVWAVYLTIAMIRSSEQ